MKFLVLALCVCAASAATFYNPAQVAQAAAQAVVTAPVVAAKAVYQTGAQAAQYAAKSAVPVGKEAGAAVLRADSEVTATGFNYLYETENGISSQASGALKKVGAEDAVVFQGSYRYVSPDGTPVEFTYIADENGYQPQSNVLPVAPEIPAAILRSLEYIRTHPAAESVKNY